MDQETERHTFQTELRRAMLSAATRQRERLVEGLRVAAESHIERTRTRGSTESDGLRRLAEDDVEGIQAWRDTELGRISTEATRRSDERNRELADALDRHGARIQAQVDAIAEAVRIHHVTLDTLFDDISVASDPAYIARQAKSVPPRLDLEAAGVRADAEPDAPVPAGTPDRPGPEGPPAPAPAAAVTDRAAITAISALRVAGRRAAEPPVDPADDTPVGSDAHGNMAIRLLRSIAGLGSQPTVSPGDHQERSG